MGFKETLTALMKKESKDKVEVAKMMGVDKSQVYRYLDESIQPKWKNVLLLLEGLGYELKIVKKESINEKLEKVMEKRVVQLKEGRS